MQKRLFLISCLMLGVLGAAMPAKALKDSKADPQEQQSSAGSTGSAASGPVVLGAGTTESSAANKASEAKSEQPEQAKLAKPAYTKTDFEQFVEDAAGQPLPIYARQLFESTPSTFAPVDRVPVPANYVLGPGDELLIRAWGRVEMDLRATIDRNGQIAIPHVGVLSVAGLRFEQIESYVRSAVGGVYKDFEINVTMGQLRSIQILVLGNARQPGTYTLGSMSTLVNALFASGGPSSTGTMRRIQLRRGDRLITEFDIYDLQMRGDKSHDVQLLPGDVIFIPSVGPQIALMGNVKQPAIYELKGDATIASVLSEAGGVTTMAQSERALLERIENHRRRRVDEFNLTSEFLNHPLQDGDLLRFYAISPQFENAVTLRGNVTNPGRYAWYEGMRVADLIPSRQLLVSADYWNQLNRQGQASQGANAAPDIMADIAQHNAEIDWDYAAIERLDERDLSTHLIPFNLGKALDDHASTENQMLKVGDVLTIFSRNDIALPIGKHASFARIGGEVNAPGVYRIEPGDTLRSLVERAGGPTAHAYLFASVLTRNSVKRLQQQQLDTSIARLQKEIVASSAATSSATAAPSSNLSGSMTQALNNTELSGEQALLAQLSATKPTGRVVLDIRREAKTVADVPDMEMEDGDVLLVPALQSTVQVMGSVYNENAFRYQPRKPIYAYLNDAGGATRDADTRRIYLIRADGSLISRNKHTSLWHGSFERIALQPGDAIIVPEHFRTASPFWTITLPLMTQIVSQAATTGVILSAILP